MDGIALLSRFGEAYRTLPGTIGSCTREEFPRKFRELFSSADARQAKGVVYVWATQKAIPRLRGESNIVYIGQTKQTLKDRQCKFAQTEASDDNWRRYEFIIPLYGPITVMYAEAAAIARTPRDAEAELLGLYFKEHLEYPPFNRYAPSSGGM